MTQKMYTAVRTASRADRTEVTYIWPGAPAEQVAAAVPPSDLVVVAYTPFHRPPARDPALAELLVALRERHAGPVLLADLYQSGQHYVDAAVTEVLPGAMGSVTCPIRSSAGFTRCARSAAFP